MTDKRNPTCEHGTDTYLNDCMECEREQAIMLALTCEHKDLTALGNGFHRCNTCGAKLFDE